MQLDQFFLNLICHLIGGALWGLAELHVLLEQHESPELLQHGLDCVLPAPPGQDGNMSHVNLTRERDTGLHSIVI